MITEKEAEIRVGEYINTMSKERPFCIEEPVYSSLSKKIKYFFLKLFIGDVFKLDPTNYIEPDYSKQVSTMRVLDGKCYNYSNCYFFSYGTTQSLENEYPRHAIPIGEGYLCLTKEDGNIIETGSFVDTEEDMKRFNEKLGRSGTEPQE